MRSLSGQLKLGLSIAPALQVGAHVGGWGIRGLKIGGRTKEYNYAESLSESGVSVWLRPRTRTLISLAGPPYPSVPRLDRYLDPTFFLPFSSSRLEEMKLWIWLIAVTGWPDITALVQSRVLRSYHEQARVRKSFILFFSAGQGKLCSSISIGIGN